MKNYDKVYRSKLVSAEEAVKIIESGMWIDYGLCTNKPDALDKALAARMEAESELTNLNFRGGIALSVPAVTQVTDAKERLIWNSRHKKFGFSCLCSFIRNPFLMREGESRTCAVRACFYNSL